MVLRGWSISHFVWVGFRLVLSDEGAVFIELCSVNVSASVLNKRIIVICIVVVAIVKVGIDSRRLLGGVVLFTTKGERRKILLLTNC